MDKCDKDELVLGVFTKGFDLKANTTIKARGPVKGARCSKSAGHSNCLQQRLLLIILDELSLQAKKCETPTAPKIPAYTEGARHRAEKIGRGDRAITLLVENVVNSLYRVEAISKQAEVQRLACLAKIEKMKENDK